GLGHGRARGCDPQYFRTARDLAVARRQSLPSDSAVAFALDTLVLACGARAVDRVDAGLLHWAGAAEHAVGAVSSAWLTAGRQLAGRWHDRRRGGRSRGRILGARVLVHDAVLRLPGSVHSDGGHG